MAKSIQLKNRNNEKIYPNPHYPVGSIYLSVNDTNPTTWFGGTWELIAKGRTLVGVDPNDTDFNTVKKTGGSKHHRHDFRIGLPFNYMDVVADNLDSDYYGAYAYSLGRYGKSRNNNERTYETTCNGNHTESYKGAGGRTASSTGDTDINSNLFPYFTCYIWCRTA